MTFPVDMRTFLATKVKDLDNAMWLLPKEVRYQTVYLQSSAVDDDTPCLMVLATRQHPNPAFSSEIVYLWSRMDACAPSGNQCIGVVYSDLNALLYKHPTASARLDLIADPKTAADALPKGSLAVTFTDDTEAHEVPVVLRSQPFLLEDREWTFKADLQGKGWTAVLCVDSEDNTAQLAVSGVSVTVGKYAGNRMARTRLPQLDRASVNEFLNHIGLSSITEDPFAKMNPAAKAPHVPMTLTAALKNIPVEGETIGSGEGKTSTEIHLPVVLVDQVVVQGKDISTAKVKFTSPETVTITNTAIVMAKPENNVSLPMLTPEAIINNTQKGNFDMNKKTTENTPATTETTVVATTAPSTPAETTPSTEPTTPPTDIKPKRIKRTAEQMLADSIKEAQELLTANGFEVKKIEEKANENTSNQPPKAKQLVEYLSDLRTNRADGDRILASMEASIKEQLTAPAVSVEALKDIQSAVAILNHIAKAE